MSVVVVRERAALAGARAHASGRVVLVPTMGALHAGHRALLRRGRELAGPDGCVIVSIFVNPLQFGPGEDLDRYPRTLDDDVEVCRDERAAVIFAPSVAEMYPDIPAITVDPGPVGDELEGEFRHGFFRGVLTVVMKLFGLVRPDTAVFGEKDAQQLALVRRMVADLGLGIEIAAVPIVRDPDGLAVSSRNQYLSPPQRATALSLSRALNAARGKAPLGPRQAITAARRVLADAKDADPPLQVDYLALADPATFAPLCENHVGEAVLAVAGRVGSTRLIDNVRLTFPGQHGPGEHGPGQHGPGQQKVRR